jgi:hypothetical protein
VKWLPFVSKSLVVALILMAAGVAGVNLREAMQRSRQKHTLANMSVAAAQIDAGVAPTNLLDGWERPMRFHRAGPHYSIRSAAADAKFQTTPLRPYTQEFSDDIVLADGAFAQFPEGICGGDRPGKGPLGACMVCHPRHIQKRANGAS